MNWSNSSDCRPDWDAPRRLVDRSAIVSRVPAALELGFSEPGIPEPTSSVLGAQLRTHVTLRGIIPVDCLHLRRAKPEGLIERGLEIAVVRREDHEVNVGFGCLTDKS